MECFIALTNMVLVIIINTTDPVSFEQKLIHEYYTVNHIKSVRWQHSGPVHMIDIR